MIKPIIISQHARRQMILRGAKENEVMLAIQTGVWQPAKKGRIHAQYLGDFNDISPVNQKFYRWKTVDAIFVQEQDKIEVVTVIVYYHN
ncbi:DUF4258 domain-containing protein [candidate division KSB1 bacterium]|nr:DUF4258 domain-containing protein [candidate division KSB1 bacterium]